MPHMEGEQNRGREAKKNAKARKGSVCVSRASPSLGGMPSQRPTASLWKRRQERAGMHERQDELRAVQVQAFPLSLGATSQPFLPQ